MKNHLAFATALAGLSVLAGCSGRTDVSLTGNTPAQYSHVWITTQEVWFNTSATAGPDDSGWRKFTLSTPATVDLVAENNGTLGSVVTGLNITPGTYSQVRLIPVDALAALTTSASEAGAVFNAEADYVDTGGNTHQLQLELLNPEKGIGISASLRVPVGNVSAAVGAASVGGTTNTSQDASFVTPTTNPTTGTVTPTTTGTTTATTTTGTTSTTPTVPPNEFAITFDGARDLVPFTFTDTSGMTPTVPNAIMLSPHGAAYDLTQVGAISGTLTLTNLTVANASSSSNESGALAIEASAEVLSADGSRHVVVSSTPVHSDGTFMIYPLAASSGHIADEYDVVIHGPNIATMIIKSVQLFQNSVTTAPTAATGTTTANTTDTTTTSTTTTSSTSNTTITPVSIGTLVPRAATPISATLTAGATPLPAGAAVSFYQTINRSGEVPYVIETSPIDPFGHVLPFAQALSTGTIDSGTWSSTGSNVTTVAAAPKETAGHYEVAATAPSYADGALGTDLGATSGTVSFTLPPMALAADTAAGTVSATVTLATPSRYDEGELLLTHDGTLVASASLDAAFAAGGGTVVLNNVPAAIPAAVYYVTVRAWSTKNPKVAVQRQSFPGALDMSSTPSGLLQLTVN